MDDFIDWVLDIGVWISSMEFYDRRHSTDAGSMGDMHVTDGSSAYGNRTGMILHFDTTLAF